MDHISIYTLKLLQKLYTKAFRVQSLSSPACVQDPDKASQMIYDALTDDKPCMIARLGSTELSAMVNYLGVKQQDRDIWQYIKGKKLPWWWNKNIINQMQDWSGFFPPSENKITQFCRLMLEDIKSVDLLGSWLPNEQLIKKQFNEKTQYVQLETMNPFFTNQPWTRALENKRILVVHPFATLIEKQYREKRINLFNNQNILPLFELQTIQAVQSIGGNTSFKDWFSALEWMENRIDKKDYDICLIGCGAYGFPLAAHVKRMGKKAVHLGGSLQLLFGIKGKRWENPNYNPNYNYAKLMNEYWVRPNKNFRPSNASKVENGCYW